MRLRTPLFAAAAALGAALAASAARAGEPRARIEWGRPAVGAFLRLSNGAYEPGPGGLGARRLHESRAYVKTPRMEAESVADESGLAMSGRIDGPARTALRGYADCARTVKVVGPPQGEPVRVLWRVRYDARIAGADPSASFSAVLRAPDGSEAARIESDAAEGAGSEARVLLLEAGRTYEVSANLEAFAATDEDRGLRLAGALRQEMTPLD